MLVAHAIQMWRHLATHLSLLITMLPQAAFRYTSINPPLVYGNIQCGQWRSGRDRDVSSGASVTGSYRLLSTVLSVRNDFETR
jgi:hypothetical protein